MESPAEPSCIRVYARVRPAKADSSEGVCVGLLGDDTVTARNKRDQSMQAPGVYTFDKVFDQDRSQQEIYDSIVRGLVKGAFDGINGTVLCYGQTCSGKTYTSIGASLLGDGRGIVPRTIEDILSQSEELMSQGQMTVNCQMSALEIYNERAIDLLHPNGPPLKIRQNIKRQVYVENSTAAEINSMTRGKKALETAIGNRAVASTSFNSRSSRSHALFIFTLTMKGIAEGDSKMAKIVIVDLAGNEKVAITSELAKTRDEARKINTSLSTLSKIIFLLSDSKFHPHIPYRDSKLTRLLQQSLGGNSQTALIVNISPEVENHTDTLASLRFGQRAKMIQNRPVVNKEFNMRELVSQLERTQRELRLSRMVIRKLKDKLSHRQDTEHQILTERQSLGNFDSEVDSESEYGDNNFFRFSTTRKLIDTESSIPWPSNNRFPTARPNYVMEAQNRLFSYEKPKTPPQTKRRETNFRSPQHKRQAGKSQYKISILDQLNIKEVSESDSEEHNRKFSPRNGLKMVSGVFNINNNNKRNIKLKSVKDGFYSAEYFQQTPSSRDVNGARNSYRNSPKGILGPQSKIIRRNSETGFQSIRELCTIRSQASIVSDEFERADESAPPQTNAIKLMLLDEKYQKMKNRVKYYRSIMSSARQVEEIQGCLYYQKQTFKGFLIFAALFQIYFCLNPILTLSNIIVQQQQQMTSLRKYRWEITSKCKEYIEEFMKSWQQIHPEVGFPYEEDETER